MCFGFVFMSINSLRVDIMLELSGMCETDRRDGKHP